MYTRFCNASQFHDASCVRGILNRNLDDKYKNLTEVIRRTPGELSEHLTSGDTSERRRQRHRSCAL